MSHGHSSIDIVAPRSKFYQGPFGRLFPELPAWAPEGKHEHELPSHFLEIANQEMVEAPGKSPLDIAGDPALIQELETKFSSKIPAGYTYFGQFIDHDITFDPASSLMRRNDPSGLLNHRTPRLDLDNVYGSGPEANPHLYQKDDPEKFLIDEVQGTKLADLPRNREGRALIGDPRNDENVMVSQLQLAFLLAHNTLVDRAREVKPEGAFERARTTLRWLYQYISWNDFVFRIANNKVHGCALKLDKTCDGRRSWSLGLEDIYSWKHQPFMPVEFAVAAYRFGHSLVRNSYQTNGPVRGFGNFAPIFDNSGTPSPDDLRGFRPMEARNYIQWDWFLQMTSSEGPFPQLGRKIDTKLSNALGNLPIGPVGARMNVLAFRNLQRGWTFGLPSGSDVARKLCLEPIDIPQDHDALWFYILKEAETLPGGNGGQMLGRVGSVIVCSTFAGLLLGDPHSYFNVEPCWTPDDDSLLMEDDKVDAGDWTLASIIRLSGLPVGAGDFDGKI
ncbi:MAG: peroxidase [Deltaproteobacteria bacterium]|nr:peroxidase [Deltaproteobacteria bacterium]